MGINGRRKGNKAERVAASLFKAWTNREFSRTPSSGGLQWKSSNVKGDIVCTKEGHYFPFCVEVKSYNKIDFSHAINPAIKNCDIFDYWKQCKRDADRANKVPLLMMRYNGLPSNFFFMVMRTNDLLNFKFQLDYPFMIIGKNEKYSLTIVPSTTFFKSNYKQIKQTIKDGRKK